MMIKNKKLCVCIALVLSLSSLLVGCGNKDNTTKEDVNVKVSAIPVGTKDIGKGRIEIVTPSGNSKDGVVPFLFVAKDTSMVQVGLNVWEFNGAKLGYIFIDGVLNTKEQLGDTQMTLTIVSDALKVGKHKVEVAQFDTDKVEGKIVCYKVGSYEIKGK